MFTGDRLLLLRGNPYFLSNFIQIQNPTLNQIANFGEERYWGVVSDICSTSYDYRLMLEEAGIDYLDIDDWTMFRTTCRGLDPDLTNILIPSVDFSQLIPMQNEDTERIVMVNTDGEIVLDEFIYQIMVDYIREVHGIKRNFEIPGNKAARDVFMWEAREAIANAKRKQFKSMLEPLISAMCNCEGFKYDYSTVWDLNIYTFMDAVRRIQKINAANHFMSGMYSGMMDVSKMGKGLIKKQTDWLGELQ